jgi:hypothetical protein
MLISLILGSDRPLRGGTTSPIKRTILLVAALAAFYPLAAADSKSEAKKDKLTVDSGIEATIAVEFADVNDETATVDWGPGSAGPEFELEAWSSARFTIPDVFWFSMGPDAEAEVRTETEVVTPSVGNPYVVLESLGIRGLLGWGMDAALNLGNDKVKGGVTLLAGVGVLDLDEADVSYLPTGASAEDFWFRIEPCLGLDASVSYKMTGMELRVHNRLLSTWDAGTAYSRSWSPGFEEGVDFSVSYRLANAGDFDWRLAASGEASLESRLIVPRLKYSLSLQTELDRKKVGSLKLRPLEFSYKADIPGLDPAQIEDTKARLTGKVEWAPDADFGSWSLYLVVPYWAQDDGAAASGEWEIGVSTKLGN